MAVPKYSEFYNVFLESLSDGQVHATNDCKDYVKKALRLTDEDMSEITASGYALWVNRMGWCATYLKKPESVKLVQKSRKPVKGNRRTGYSSPTRSITGTKKCRHHGSNQSKTIFEHAKLTLLRISQGRKVSFYDNQVITKR